MPRAGHRALIWLHSPGRDSRKEPGASDDVPAMRKSGGPPSGARDIRSAALRAVSIGEVDAYVTETASAAWYMQQEGIANLTVAGESGFVYEMGFACRRDWPELVGIFEKGLGLISDEERHRLRGDVLGILQKGEYEGEELADHIRDAIPAHAVNEPVERAWPSSPILSPEGPRYLGFLMRTC